MNVMKQSSSWAACNFAGNPFFCADTTPFLAVPVDSHDNPTAIPLAMGIPANEQAIKSAIWLNDPAHKDHTPIVAMDWVFMFDGELLADMFEFTCQGGCGTDPAVVANWSPTSGGGHKITLSINQLTAEGNFFVYLHKIGTAPPTNFRLVPADMAVAYENLAAGALPANDSELFNPDFLSSLDAYFQLGPTHPDNPIRFMDWLQTNFSPITSWSQRGEVEDYSWATAGGVPYEVIARLGNHFFKPIWINYPHQADVQYATELANLLKTDLDPGIAVFQEYSNEVWNGFFPQHAYVRDIDPSETVYENYARLAVERFDAFAAADPARTTVRVLAGQSANIGVAQQILSANVPDDNGVPASTKADAVAIAPYFEARTTFSDEDLNFLVDSLDPNAPATVDLFLQVVEAAVSEPNMAAVAALFPMSVFPQPDPGNPTVGIRTDPDATTMPEQVTAHKAALAASANTDLLLTAYEGGQHYIVPLNAPGTQAQKDKLEALYDNVVNDPRMYCVYWHYFDNITVPNIRMYAHYTDVGPDKTEDEGRFGALESVGDWANEGQDASPVYRVLGDYTRGAASSYLTTVVLPTDTGTNICADVP
ncbi:MAG: hypothetical protein GY937_25025 [bacterium]|nr:hypothetical protein [bacterium]